MITLIGMAGVGKSDIGKALADYINWKFLDSDDLFLSQVNELVFKKPSLDKSLEKPEDVITIDKVIKKVGEEEFLKREASLVQSAVLQTELILATGGSVPYSDEAMVALQAVSKIVYLEDSLENILLKVKTFDNRGVIRKGKETIEEVFKERLPLYEKWSDETINVNGKTKDEVVREIAKKLNLI